MEANLARARLLRKELPKLEETMGSELSEGLVGTSRLEAQLGFRVTFQGERPTAREAESAAEMMRALIEATLPKLKLLLEDQLRNQAKAVQSDFVKPITLPKAMKTDPETLTVHDLLDLKKNQLLYVNPEYQRGHVWTKAQQKRLRGC